MQVFNCIDSFAFWLKLCGVWQDVAQESNKNESCVISDDSIPCAGFSSLEATKIYLKIEVS